MRSKIVAFLLIALLALIQILISSNYLIHQGTKLLLDRRNAIDLSLLEKLLKTDNRESSGHEESSPFQSFIANPENSSFLEQVSLIKNFAHKLGFEDTPHYNSMVFTDEDFLVAVLSGSRPYAFDPYLWSFPFFGEAPYLGFIDLEDAQKEQERLEEEGYETYVRAVEAFSSLGLFVDPLYSYMVDYSEARLSELIIHEMLHSTVWIDGAISFNESLANAVAQEAAGRYLYSFDKGLHEDYVMERERREWYFRQIANVRTSLDSYYQFARHRGYDESKIFEARQTIYQSFLDSISGQFIEYYGEEPWTNFSQKPLNNAFLALFGLYGNETFLFQTLVESYGEDYESLFADLREGISPANPFEDLRFLVDQRKYH